MITAAAATRRSTTDLSTVRQAGGPVTSCDESDSYYSSIAIAMVTMATSIQVSRELHEKLKVLKQRMDVETFEELLTRLIARPRQASRARFGAHPNMKAFAHRDESHAP